MSVKRCEIIKYLEKSGYHLLRENKKHSVVPTVIPPSP
jgi:hypothetical protein